eukprot:TRINITY_DN272_c0_g5_i1.p2 TRINITY_DN272_c0_g5~~TRINITY_DN272_c0_g5_i1.p2  ORF type:complete len:114 (-),score=25.19 TRINITY_DN272_c0_g5_i1:119-460(-)
MDELAVRCSRYRANGASFVKWRTVFKIGKGIPSQYAINLNQRHPPRLLRLHCPGMVPIVEPEVSMEGSHSLDECYAATVEVQSAVVRALHVANVYLDVPVRRDDRRAGEQHPA